MAKSTHSISNTLPLAWAWRGLAFVFLIAIFASCSESDDVESEWVNWQDKNDTYWATLYTQTKARIAAGDTSWKIIPNWEIVNQKPFVDGTTLTYDSTDYIIVHVEETGTGTESPLYTDTVSIHYLGRMIPSPTYTSGYVFDASYNYNEPYNIKTMRPYTGKAGSFINGFTTAVMNMHPGDRWTVYIPYQLAYGSSTPGSSSSTYGSVSYTSTSSSSSVGIQPYSDLIFDITLVDFYKPGEKVPTVF